MFNFLYYSDLAKLLFIIAMPWMFSACSPIKGYPGPELPENQISTLFLSYDSQQVEINQAGIEGVAFGSSGIQVLPGKRLFDLEISIKEPPDNCYSFPKMNRYDYHQCLKKKEDWKCNCYDYLEIYRRCFRQVRDGVCSGDVTTSAGLHYDIRVMKRGRAAEVEAYNQSNGSVHGEGDCDMGDWRTESDDDYLGTGEYTANSNGIYGCY